MQKLSVSDLRQFVFPKLQLSDRPELTHSASSAYFQDQDGSIIFLLDIIGIGVVESPSEVDQFISWNGKPLKGIY